MKLLSKKKNAAWAAPEVPVPVQWLVAHESGERVVLVVLSDGRRGLACAFSSSGARARSLRRGAIRVR
jgi:hypothetical protein